MTTQLSDLTKAFAGTIGTGDVRTLRVEDLYDDKLDITNELLGKILATLEAIAD